MAESHSKNPRKIPGMFRLFFKQSVASFLCGILFFLMNTLPVPVLNNSARALGNALRYETKIPTEKLPHWLTERMTFPK